MISRKSHLSGKAIRFPNIDFLRSLRPARMKLGLRNINRLLEILGNPQRNFPAIHVAGTNGKGSVTAFLSSILSRGGFRVGSFYSPHLFRINQRIRINGEEIPSPRLDEILGKLKSLHSQAPFTYFEGITAAAILYFMDNVDIAVFEVGLGGRLDATRLVNSAISVITGISRDHSRHLGDTEEQILGEKLGIVKEGVPVAVNLEDKKLALIAQQHCRSSGSPFFNIADQTRVAVEGIKKECMSLSLETEKRNYGRIDIKMIGKHQSKNAATAVRVIELLEPEMLYREEKEGRQGVEWPVCVDAGKWKVFREGAAGFVAEGLERAVSAGRFQVISSAPTVIMDVAHNEEALIASLGVLDMISRPEKSVIIFSYLSRKDPGEFPARVVESARKVILAPLRSTQGVSEEELRKRFQPYLDRGVVEFTGNIQSAVDLAMKCISVDDALLILGSHMIVEEAAAFL